MGSVFIPFLIAVVKYLTNQLQRSWGGGSMNKTASVKL